MVNKNLIIDGNLNSEYKLDNKLPKPFIRWAGGKQKLVKYIIPFLPSNKFNMYFEPFLGAGSLFFSNTFEKPFLSDINKHLINSYLAIKENPLKVFSMLQKFQARLNKDYYYIIRRDFNKKINQFSFVQAVRFIFLIHTSYNGIYRVNKKGEYNVPVGKLKPCLATKENLIKISKKLKLAEIRNCHYSDIFDFANKNDFVYLDPPYPPLNGKSYFQHYTVDKFPAHEQEKLAEFTNQLDKKGVNVLISNANTSFIRNLYKPWDMTKLKTIRFVSCKSKRNKVVELLIKNY